MKKLRIAIIGCRNMGQKHLKTLREYFTDTVEVAGILCSSPESSAQRAAELNVPYFTNIDEITLNTVDAAIISTPARTHAKIGEELLLRGIPCLIEKPLAPTLSECDRLISAAKSSNSMIIIGHTENYNPAVIRLKQELQHPITKIKGIRTSQNASNKTGISAIQELMIHDIAIIQALLGDNILSSSVHKRPDLSWENHAIVEMKYKNGAEVKLEALREDRPVERYMDIEDTQKNTFHIEFMERRLIKNGQILTQEGNSLQNELADFINCIRHHTEPLISTKEAKNIVKLCLNLEKGIPDLSLIKTVELSR